MIELILLGIIVVLVICLINQKSGNQSKTSSDSYEKLPRKPVHVRVNPLPQQGGKVVSFKTATHSRAFPSFMRSVV